MHRDLMGASYSKLFKLVLIIYCYTQKGDRTWVNVQQTKIQAGENTRSDTNKIRSIKI